MPRWSAHSATFFGSDFIEAKSKQKHHVVFMGRSSAPSARARFWVQLVGDYGWGSRRHAARDRGTPAAIAMVPQATQQVQHVHATNSGSGQTQIEELEREEPYLEYDEQRRVADAYYVMAPNHGLGHRDGQHDKMMANPATDAKAWSAEKFVPMRSTGYLGTGG